MALYDGFFDATQNEGTGEYDRTYGADDFTGYFAHVIGSGVCVHNDPDSFRVRMEDGQVVVSPGYLFIQGYWLKNNADYPITLPGTSNYAIVARLNLGTRMIELEARTIETAYTDSLVLAIVSPTSAEDTRYNTDLCGVIDTAGELSTKVEWAINYIDNEIEAKLADIERQIAEQSAKLDAEIAAVQAVADSITPPPVGTIKFSAAQNVGKEWLRCDGSFINESDYPELVEALGKLTPSADKFHLISNGEIGPQISNGVVYEGRMWVYSYSTQKLYGVDLDGGGTKEITVTSEDPDFTRVHIPSTTAPIALSIVKSPVDGKVRIFFSQILAKSDGISKQTVEAVNPKDYIWLYSAEFSASESSVSVFAPFNKLSFAGSDLFYFTPNNCVPYVISQNVGGIETFSTVIGTAFNRYGSICAINWGSGNTATAEVFDYYGTNRSSTLVYFTNGQRMAFSPKSKGEAVCVDSFTTAQGASSYVYYTYIRSHKNGTFARSNSGNSSSVKEILGTPGPLNIVGEDKMLFEPSTSAALVISIKDLDIPHQINFGLFLPSGARTFVDGGAYLWGKDIYMLFVGTGIIFSRTLEEGSFGYLDTTSILGNITQFGYLDYSQDEGTLYLLGQDTTNSVKVAKIVLNTLYDYANDGAWLLMLASDGVPAYIKAYEPETGGGAISDPVNMKITVTIDSTFARYADLLFNGETLIAGIFTRTVSQSENFTVGVRIKERWTASNISAGAKLNGTVVASVAVSNVVGAERTASFRVSDYVSSGITLTGAWNV